MKTDRAEKPLTSDKSGREPKLTYVLVTAARNEAAFIERTIMSMISQTVTPLKWVIVSDGSTDGTDDIVRKYIPEYQWIELMRMPERHDRNFAGKAHAFNAGYAKVNGLKFDIIGNIDADISFGQDHFEFLIEKFIENTSLGVAGTAFIEDSTIAYNYDFVNIEHVSGQCQLFRRSCYDAIGGYLPIKGGGVDWTAVTTARMKGWKTRTFPERAFTHHRQMGTGISTLLTSRFRFGRQDYYLGGHPLWEIFRSIYQMTKKPYMVGGILLLIGFYWSMLTRVEKSVTKELEVFRRREQMQRLRAFFKKVLLLRGD
jgi:poly-beta-1,6-N-acetyl-D-glucosamine synthase